MNEKMKAKEGGQHSFSNSGRFFFGEMEGRNWVGIMYNLIHSSGRQQFIHCFPRSRVRLQWPAVSTMLKGLEGRKGVGLGVGTSNGEVLGLERSEGGVRACKLSW